MNNLKKLVLYPILLAGICYFFYILYLVCSNFTPRMYFYDQAVSKLSQTPTISQFSFLSRENFLGIISIENHNIFPYPITDVFFRIREAGTDNWIVENHYIGPDLDNVQSVLFGLPVQENSAGKTYIFEIETNCIEEESCFFNPEFSEILVRHYFSKSFYLNSPLQALKIVSSKIYENFLLRSEDEKWIVFMAPFVAYYSLYIFLKSQKPAIVLIHQLPKLTILITGADTILLFLIFLDIFLQNTWSFYVLAALSVCYVLKIKGPISVKFSLLATATLYYLGIIMSIVGIQYAASRLGLWAFVFFCLTISILVGQTVLKIWRPDQQFQRLRQRLKRLILARAGTQKRIPN